MQNRRFDARTLRWFTVSLLLFLAILLLGFNIWIGASSASGNNGTPTVTPIATATLLPCKPHQNKQKHPCSQSTALPTRTATKIASPTKTVTPTKTPNPVPMPTITITITH